MSMTMIYSSLIAMGVRMIVIMCVASMLVMAMVVLTHSCFGNKDEGKFKLRYDY